MVCFAGIDNISDIELMFLYIIIYLTSTNTDINRVSKELPTGEVLSTRMLVCTVICWLEIFIKSNQIRIAPYIMLVDGLDLEWINYIW